MPRIPKWFQSYLQQTETSFSLIIFIAIITGITSFGLPSPPPMVKKFFDNYPWFKWIMLWLLIYQGGSGQNVMITNIAFSIVFTFYNLDWEQFVYYLKTYKHYLVFLSPLLYYFFKN